MASRKVLKKNVNYIAGELFAECLMNSLYVPGTDKKKADELMAEILKMQDEFNQPHQPYRTGKCKRLLQEIPF